MRPASDHSGTPTRLLPLLDSPVPAVLVLLVVEYKILTRISFFFSAGPGDSETAPYEGDPNGVRGQLAGNSGSYAARAGGHPPRGAVAPQEKGRGVAKDAVFFYIYFFIFFHAAAPGVTLRVVLLRLETGRGVAQDAVFR